VLTRTILRQKAKSSCFKQQERSASSADRPCHPPSCGARLCARPTAPFLSNGLPPLSIAGPVRPAAPGGAALEPKRALPSVAVVTVPSNAWKAVRCFVVREDWVCIICRGVPRVEAAAVALAVTARGVRAGANFLEVICSRGNHQRWEGTRSKHVSRCFPKWGYGAEAHVCPPRWQDGGRL